jgi:hypothetical protein
LTAELRKFKLEGIADQLKSSDGRLERMIEKKKNINTAIRRNSELARKIISSLECR